MSGARITISYDDHEVLRGLELLQRAAQDTRPLLEDIGESLLRSTFARWGDEEAPDGSRWKQISPSAQMEKVEKGKIQKILERDGHLRTSIVRLVEGGTLIIGTNKEYAAIHQFGGTTKPHKIAPKKARALAWFGMGSSIYKTNKRGRQVLKSMGEMMIFARHVNHPGSKIPARPFLGISSSDQEMILRKVRIRLEDALKP